MKAVTGKELPMQDADRESWLPMLVACVLAHGDVGSRLLHRVQSWAPAGLALIKGLFQAEDPWSVLMHSVLHTPPEGLEDPKSVLMGLEQCTSDLKAHMLLALVDASWGVALEQDAPVQDNALADILTAWVGRLQTADLWDRDQKAVIEPHVTTALLDALIPTQDHGEKNGLWSAALRQVPLDAWLLQGEAVDGRGWGDSQPCVLLGLYPPVLPPARTRLALQLYQSVIVLEGVALKYDNRVNEFNRSRSRSLSLSLFVSRSLSLSRSLSSWQYWASHLQHVSSALQTALKRLVERDFSDDETLVIALMTFNFQYAAHDWFQEQSEDPELMRRRGLRPNEALPKAFNLFDQNGRLQPTQKRDNLVQLHAWLGNDEAMLNFTFPNGLPEAEKNILREDLAMLKQQSWSPQAGLAALLQDWAATDPDRTCTLEEAEREFILAIDAFFQRRKQGESGQPGE